MCGLEGCERPVNRDGLCFYHKIKTVQVDTGVIKRERDGVDVSMGRGTREYVHDMYKRRRAAGLPDPVAKNEKAGAFAPPPPIDRTEWKKHNE